jgi:hypothetical protein
VAQEWIDKLRFSDAFLGKQDGRQISAAGSCAAALEKSGDRTSAVWLRHHVELLTHCRELVGLRCLELPAEQFSFHCLAIQAEDITPPVMICQLMCKRYVLALLKSKLHGEFCRAVQINYLATEERHL